MWNLLLAPSSASLTDASSERQTYGSDEGTQPSASEASDARRIRNRKRQRQQQEEPPERHLAVIHCGCVECTDSVWNSAAPSSTPEHTCGTRVTYVQSTGKSYEDACRQIAGGTGVTGEFPAICGKCNPDKCTKSDRPQSGLSPTELYCFKSSSQRKRWSNAWNKYDVEVKSSSSLCDPNGNMFSDQTVGLTNSKELTLQFKKVDGVWSGAEVRVLLPQAKQPYSYGTYSFRIKSVGVIDATTKQTIRKYLDPRLAIGVFTYDPTPAAEGNYRNEVDIVEISQWGSSTGSDAQFTIQPPGLPHYYRFATGPNGSFNPGSGNWYNVTWNPTSVQWKTTANGGKSLTYTTAQALSQGKPDYIQCLPATTEIRLNLWNMGGTARPSTMSNNHVAQVVFDSFSFTPNYVVGVANGGTCSKPCQCVKSSTCVNNKCRAKT
jgi:hypothetical protein